MVVCPVCEHQQAFGVECDVCGKDLGDLGGLGPPPVAEAKVEGLEVTIPERVGDVPIERVGELDAHIVDSAGITVAPEVVADLDVARASVGEVAVERVADLSVDRAPDDGQRTAAPTGAVRCRVCQNVQAEGLLCNVCGYRLPRTQVPIVQAGVAPPRQTFSRGDVRCRACGAPAVPGERCSECGALAPLPT